MNLIVRSDIRSVILFSNASLIFLFSFPVALINNLLLRCDGKITHTQAQTPTHTHHNEKKYIHPPYQRWLPWRSGLALPLGPKAVT